MRILPVLRNDQRGNVLMLTGLSILFLFAMAGAGVDFGRQQLVRMKLQNASDAAAIAAASMPPSTSTEQRRQVALRYFNLNYPTTYLGVARPNPNIQIGEQIIVDAGTAFDTNFIGGVGVNRLESQGRTVVNQATQAESIYDVILVLDNSNSMSRTTAAPNYLSTTAATRQNARNLIIPYCRNTWRYRLNYDCGPDQNLRPVMGNGYSRNPRYNNETQCRNNYLNEFCGLTGNATGVSDGSNNYITNGAAPESFGYSFTGNTRLNALRSIASSFVTRVIDEGVAGSRVSLVRFSSDTIFPIGLTNDASTLQARINDMAGWGGTNPYVAMQQALAYSRDFATDRVKAVVFMSDGKPTMMGPLSSTNYRDSAGCDGELYCSQSATNTQSICNQLKNAGVQVYTVGFFNPTDREFAGANSGDYTRAQDFMRNCASVNGEGNPNFYTAQNGAELEEAFSQILTSLGKIRISQ